MEEGVRPERDFFGMMEEALSLPERDYSQLPPLVLAYIGDSVFDLAVRTMAVRQSPMQTGKLHRKVSDIVCARSQAAMGKMLRPLLTAEESAVYRRGHNAQPDHNAKNASRSEYLEATAFEALIGYLYLEKRFDRLTELMTAVLAEPQSGE